MNFRLSSSEEFRFSNRELNDSVGNLELAKAIKKNNKSILYVLKIYINIKNNWGLGPIPAKIVIELTKLTIFL